MEGLLIAVAIALTLILLGAIADHAEHRWLERKVQAGFLPGSVKVTSGSQPGFPRRHWRRVMAHVSPWRLDCRGRYRWWWNGSIDVTGEPRWREAFPVALNLRFGHQHGFMNVIELETATATLKWAVPETRVAWAVSTLLGTPSGGEAGYDGVHVRR